MKHLIEYKDDKNDIWVEPIEGANNNFFIGVDFGLNESKQVINTFCSVCKSLINKGGLKNHNCK